VYPRPYPSDGFNNDLLRLYSFRNRGIENSDGPKEEWQHLVPFYPTSRAWGPDCPVELEEYIYGTRKSSGQVMPILLNVLAYPWQRSRHTRSFPTGKESEFPSGYSISCKEFCHCHCRIWASEISTLSSAKATRKRSVSTRDMISNNRKAVSSVVKSGLVNDSTDKRSSYQLYLREEATYTQST
jgi:hypothetical protein